MSDIYWGAKAFKALYVSSNILKDIRRLTGSQWRSIKTGVILSYLRVRKTTRPAALWTRWSLSIKYCGSPANNELQLSSLVVINTWNNVSVSFRERQFLILDRLRIRQKATLQIWLTCCLRSIKLSKITPMFLAFTDFPTLTPAIVISSIGGHGQCLTCITKNFSRLSYSLLHTIQA